jgi:DNA-binding transcriptional LysR family regulator
MESMDRNLAAFLAVARSGTLSQAARQLLITQPSLTKRLQNLEESYDCQLFERLPRGMRLTAFGERLYVHAERIEQEYIQSRESIASEKSNQLDELRIGAGPLFHLRYLAPALHALRQEYPRMDLLLEADVNPILLPKLRNGGLDIVFGMREDVGGDDHLRFRPLTPVHTGVVIRADHPVAAKARLKAEDLTEFEWVIYSGNPDFVELVNHLFRRSGLKPPERALQTTSFTAGLHYVELGNALMTIPLQLAPVLRMPNLKALPTDPLISENIGGAFFRRSSETIPAISRMVELVADLCASVDPPGLRHGAHHQT